MVSRHVSETLPLVSLLSILLCRVKFSEDITVKERILDCVSSVSHLETRYLLTLPTVIHPPVVYKERKEKMKEFIKKDIMFA